MESIPQGQPNQYRPPLPLPTENDVPGLEELCSSAQGVSYTENIPQDQPNQNEPLFLNSQQIGEDLDIEEFEDFAPPPHK